MNPQQRIAANRLGLSIDRLIAALGNYCDAHKAFYGTPAGDDGFIGESCNSIASAIGDLLSGERGASDGATQWTALHKVMKAAKLGEYEYDKGANDV